MREGSEACLNRKSYRADTLEPTVWRLVANLLADPEIVRKGFEAMIRLEHNGARGDPDRETRAWLGRLVEVERMRGDYQEMKAKGLMTFDELGAWLEELENIRGTALHGLEAARERRGSSEGLERDRDVLESYARSSSRILKRLEPEERRRIYRMLRLEVRVGADGNLTVNSILDAAALTFV